jgi:hypothetical protein
MMVLAQVMKSEMAICISNNEHTLRHDGDGMQSPSSTKHHK